MQYDTQQLLFSQSPPIISRGDSTPVPEEFYEAGYSIIKNIGSPEQAISTLSSVIGNLDPNRLPLYGRFASQIQLAKADVIPVCDDVVATSFQALHFDMGQPIISEEPQTMYLITGLYLDKNAAPVTAKTRIISLKGLFSDQAQWGKPEEIEDRLIKYVNSYGDGWADINTRRLACFARVLDAVNGTTDVASFKDRTMGQWFINDKNVTAEECLRIERDFYFKHGIELRPIERHINLQPGQLLFFDNTRVIHGRFGQRKAKEVYQLMFGVEHAMPDDIDAFRRNLIQLLTENASTIRAHN